MRKTMKPRRRRHGRRMVEDDEFCHNCDRLKHDQEIYNLRDEKIDLLDLMYEAWVVIANSSDWYAGGEWREAAEMWREKYHKVLRETLDE